ncbi:MAG: hypothetical protein Q9191_002932, partial [Dirinaria sp. TL-2023a]
MVAPFVKRSVSPLEAEPISLLPEDEFFARSDDERSENELRRKRRRIEDLGRKYLEGKPLFILSAGLKGPFKPGWNNPWRKNKDVNHVIEIQKQPTSRPSSTRGHLANVRGVSNGNTGNAGLKSAHLPPPDVRTSTDWLRSDQSYPAISVNANPEASTPAPSPQAIQQVNPGVPTARSTERSQSPTERHVSRFTPINKQIRAHSAVPRNAPPLFTDTTHKPSPIEPPDAQNDATFPQQPRLFGEIESNDTNDIVREGYMNGNDVGQKALDVVSKSRSSHDRTTAQTPLPAPRSGNFTNGEDPEGNSAAGEVTTNKDRLVDVQDALMGKKLKTPPEKTAIERGSFAQQLRASKARVTAKRLSFTPYGGIKSLDSRSSFVASSASSVDFRHANHASSQSSQKRSKNASSSAANGSSPTSARAGPSDICPQGPEAQLVSAPLGRVGISAAPSGPSTNIMETTHGTDEGDSYLDLSTQAAITKAQRAFQIDLTPSLQASPADVNNGISQLSPTAVKASGAGTSPKLRNAPSKPITPKGEMLNTQAMLEAISPFAVTTIKKRNPPAKSEEVQKRASFVPSPVPSPTHTFGPTRRSLSMSTSSDSSSPSPAPQPRKPLVESKPTPMLSKASTATSKPVSTATSTAFSIAPNGTLTEVYQQDGQQPIDAAMGVGMGTEDWDTDEAIQEADSFLGTWNIELEARNQSHAVPNG